MQDKEKMEKIGLEVCRIKKMERIGQEVRRIKENGKDRLGSTQNKGKWKNGSM